MEFTWVEDQRLERRCPLCGTAADHPVIIRYHAPFRDRPLRRLLRCEGCGSPFLDDLSEPPDIEDGDDARHRIAFYVELQAGIDVMLDTLYKVDHRGVERYLEVGCGFGFSIDYAARRLGWQAHGIDGGAMARAGAAMLGIDIRTRHLAPDDDVGSERADLILCSEVIEHVPDPKQLLTHLARALAPDGALLLTTPDARQIRRDTPAALLMQILTPGFHLVLFTPETLERALKESGFTHIEVWQKEATLLAVAARQPVAVSRRATIGIEPYTAYLSERAAIEPRPSSLSVGMLYRLLKTRTMASDYALADAAFADLARHCRALYAIAIDDPASLGLETLAPLDLAAVSDHLPFSIGCILYHRGVSLLNHHCDPKAALAAFRAAAKASTMIQQALVPHGLDDSDNETAFWLSWVLAGVALAQCDPAAAVRALQRLDQAPDGDDGLWPVPPELAPRARTELFVRLVNGGHFAAAAVLAPWIAQRFGLETGVPPAAPTDTPEALNGLYSLGALRLHHQGDAKGAMAAFAAVDEAARRRLAQDDADQPLQELTQRTRLSLVIATSIVDPKAAIAQLQELRRTPPGPLRPADAALRQTRDDVFVRLVNGGAHIAALKLAEEIGDDGRLYELARPQGFEAAEELLTDAPVHLLNALFCLAMLKLNYQLLPELAARIFAVIHYACRGKLKAGDQSDAVGAMLWESGYNRVLAFKVAGQLKPMAAAAEELLAPKAQLPVPPAHLAQSLQAIVA